MPWSPLTTIEGVVEFADFFEALDQDAQASVNGLTFAQVVAYIFADFVYIGQEVG